MVDAHGAVPDHNARERDGPIACRMDWRASRDSEVDAPVTAVPPGRKESTNGRSVGGRREANA